MFRNYLTTALRNLGRHKLFSFINISGLAIGISAALIIFMIVAYEFSFENFEKDSNRIYRVVSTMHFPDQEFANSGIPVPLAGAAKRELTGIDIATHFFLFPGKPTVICRDKNEKPTSYKQQANIAIVDENYFSLLSYKWLAGTPAVLKDPFKIVIAESRAKTYFGNTDPKDVVGKTVIYNDSIQLTVAGIVEDIRYITDFTFKEFVSYPTVEKTGLKTNLPIDQWGSVNSHSQFFIKLRPGIRPAQIEKQANSIYTKNADNAYLKTSYTLQPLRDIHFNTQFDNFSQRQAHKPTLYGLMVLAVFLLLLGCINFINLTTAQALQRAKEIGIRKTMGSSKKQLITQFLSETLLLTLLATVFALLLIPGLLRVFAGFIPAEITIYMLLQPHVLFFTAGLIITVSILSGLYPAFVLSSYNPSLVLKNQAFSSTGKSRKAGLRKTLTVCQFVIAQFFIIATLIVTKQINYSLHKDLGFRKDAIISFSAPSEREDIQSGNRLVLQQKLKAIPGIEMVSLAGSTPANQGYSITTMKFNTGKREIETTVEVKYADTNYFRLFGMKLLAGHYLQQSDTIKEYLINNTYAKFLGFRNPADAIGKFIEKGSEKIPVSGVLADFHSQSLHTDIKPLAYASAAANHFDFHILLGKAGTVSWNNTIAKIQKVFKAIYPGEEFHYEFFEDHVAKFYETEQKVSRLLGWATGLAVFISCLGLLGLVIYTTGARTKEIGVRKVLGASVSQVVVLLSRDFLRLVVFAILIAAPAAWWVMYRWLENFAYRTSISWWVFLVSSGLMIVIALLTLSIQTIRSATANPVKSLRTE